LCPHASGTASHASLEPAAIIEALGRNTRVCLLKPFTGHGIGGGGLLESALLTAFLREKRLPAPLPGLTGHPDLPTTSRPLPPGATLFNLASALGGKNSLIAIQAPP